MRSPLLVQAVQLQRSGPELSDISSGDAGGHLLHWPRPADGVWPQEVQDILTWGMTALRLKRVCRQMCIHCQRLRSSVSLQG